MGSRRLDGRRGRRALDPSPAGGRRLLLRLGVSPQSLPLGLPPHPIGLGVLDRGRVGLDPYPEIETEIESFLVREPKLTCKLVDADLLRQLCASVLSE
jgi:hypothetical protein